MHLNHVPIFGLALRNTHVKKDRLTRSPKMFAYGGYDNDSSGPDGRMKNRRNPIHEHGGVILNGVKARQFLESLRVKPNPKYKAPRGKFALSNEEVFTGEIVWSDPTMTEASAYMIHSGDERDPGQISVPGLSSINKIGYADESRDQIQSNIHVWGVATSGTKETSADSFNIFDGGIITITNNGSKYITAGTWIMSYLPRVSELAEGGTDTPESASGRHTLWTMPYNPAVHKATVNSVYSCLQSVDPVGGREDSVNLPEGGYHQRYVRSCRDFERSVQDLAFVVIRTLLDNKVLALHQNFTKMLSTGPVVWGTTADKSQVGYVLTALMGRDPMTTASSAVSGQNFDAALSRHVNKQHMQRFVETAKKVKKDIRQNMFPRQSNKDWFVSPSKPGKSVEDEVMCQLQSEAAELYLLSTAQAFHEISRLLLGRANTSAGPRTDFDIRLSNYAK